jgi:outer membrane protein assembly factor BamD (BamD/ComL family)
MALTTCFLQHTGLERLRTFVAFLIILALAVGCASTTQELLEEVETVTVCLNGKCGPAAGKVSADELTGSLYIMFKANENSEAVLCGTEEGAAECTSDAIGWFVQGGPMPGKATMKKPVPLQVRLDEETKEIRFEMDATVRWIGTPVFCGDGKTSFTEVSAEKVTMQSEFGCSWTAFPHVWDQQYAIRLIDFDNSIIAGNYAVAGAGFYVAGGGKGGFSLRLPRKNTLVSQVAGAVSGKARLISVSNVPADLLAASSPAVQNPQEPDQAPLPEAGSAEKALWENVSRKKAAAGYREYLQRYPEGRYAGAAAAILAAIDEREAKNRELAFWSSIKDSPNPEDFEMYLARFPRGLFVDLATVRIQKLKASASEAAAIDAELLLWDQVKASTDISEIQVYIQQYPNGRFTTAARKRIKNLTVAENEKQNLEVKMWSAVKDSRNINDFQNFLKAFPDGLFAGIATARMENLIRMDAQKQELAFWNTIKDSADPKDFSAYLKRYPSGQYAEHARRLAAQLSSLQSEQAEVALWASVKASKNPADFDAYLKKYPRGRFTAVARTRQKAAAHAQMVANIDFGRYHALVVGNDDYTYIRDLKTAGNDARAVGELLEQAYRFEVTYLINATRKQIIDEMSRLRRKLTANDNLLIYFAGHGWLDPDANRGYWLPVDAERDSSANWISTGAISDFLKAMAAKHVIVVADSCFSGTLSRAIKLTLPSSEYLRRIAGKRARVALTSGGVEPVLDDGREGHSVFAAAFLDALEQNKGVLEGSRLFNQIRQPVILNAPQTPEYSDILYTGHEGGDFLFIHR